VQTSARASPRPSTAHRSAQASSQANAPLEPETLDGSPADRQASSQANAALEPETLDGSPVDWKASSQGHALEELDGSPVDRQASSQANATLEPEPFEDRICTARRHSRRHIAIGTADGSRAARTSPVTDWPCLPARSAGLRPFRRTHTIESTRHGRLIHGAGAQPQRRGESCRPAASRPRRLGDARGSRDCCRRSHGQQAHRPAHLTDLGSRPIPPAAPSIHAAPLGTLAG
jgi:hypothetical protein